MRHHDGRRSVDQPQIAKRSRAPEAHCHGQANDYLAVWKKVGQTAYTVRNADYNVCSGTHPTGGQFIIWSPNSHNRGTYYYCVYGRQYVRWLGDRWLDTTPIPGGP